MENRGEIIWNSYEEACAMAAILMILRNVFIEADIESYGKMDLIELMDEAISKQGLEPWVDAMQDQIESMELDGRL